MTFGVPQIRRHDDQVFVYAWSRITGAWCIGFGYGTGGCADVRSTRYVVILFDDRVYKKYVWINPNYFVTDDPYNEVEQLIENYIKEET